MMINKVPLNRQWIIKQMYGTTATHFTYNTKNPWTEAELKKACIAMQRVQDIYSKQKVPSRGSSVVKEHECGERGIFSVCTNYTVCVLSPGTLVTPRRSSVWQAGYYNSPEKCPCPLAPRKSACSRAVHCWGCRGPSLLRGPVEPLEEAVPVELWPPGDGKQGLL